MNDDVLYVVYDKECQRPLFRTTDRFLAQVRAAEIHGWIRLVDHWTTADGRRIPMCDLTLEHMINIVKYGFTTNRVPTSVLEELAFRDELKAVGERIAPAEGYLSPEELGKRDIPNNYEGTVS